MTSRLKTSSGRSKIAYASSRAGPASALRKNWIESRCSSATCTVFQSTSQIVFLEVERTDASEFAEQLQVKGERCRGHCVLKARSPIVANSIAALLIHVEQMTGRVPHIYFKWKEGNPVANIFRFLFLGEGDVAPLAHEVLRKAVPEVTRRPVVHVS